MYCLHLTLHKRTCSQFTSLTINLRYVHHQQHQFIHKTLAYTRFVLMTGFGMNFACIKETAHTYVN